MIESIVDKRRRVFGVWLRTGHLPSPWPDGIEVKFNPWHDPEDGRFTFAGPGHYYGAGGGEPANRRSDRAPRISDRDNSRMPRIATKPNANLLRAGQPARSRNKPGDGGAIEAPPKPPAASPPGARQNPVAEFVGGAREGLYDVAKGAVEGVYSVLTTNPLAM